MNYELDDNGNVVAWGNIKQTQQKKGNEPINKLNASDWRWDGQKWVTTIVNYQYVIIPTDLIPQLVNMSGLVDDVITGEEFTVYFNSIEITAGNGKKKGVKTLPVSFTPCTVIEWELGDDERLQGVIDMFNETYNPPREIDFTCKFDNRMALDDFIASVKN